MPGFCARCGNELRTDARFCTTCGADRSTQDAEVAKRASQQPRPLAKTLGRRASGRRVGLAALLATTALAAVLLFVFGPSLLARPSSVPTEGTQSAAPSGTSSPNGATTGAPSGTRASVTSAPSPVAPSLAANPIWLAPPLRVDTPAELLGAIDELAVQPATGSQFQLRDVSVSGDWAIASAEVAGPVGQNTSPSETISVLAHHTDAGWQVVSDRDRDMFCALLVAAPPTLLSDDVRAYFIGCAP